MYPCGYFRDGYVISAHCPITYRRERIDVYDPAHRLIMEWHMGRRLGSNEHVHHLNGARDDNDDANLVVLAIKQHSRMSLSEARKRRKALYSYTT
jgi:hypothetical protein